MKIAFCYPGQGVQQVGMAEGFVKSGEHYADMISEATKASGVDMNKLLFEPNDDINITEYTQPALVTACCIITDALLLAGIKPDVTAGLSLGEYCSLYVAGALGFEDAVRLTRIRGRLMSNAVPAGEGTMAAIIGLTQEQVEAVTNTIENVWPANFNCPGQIVITGKKEAVEKAMPLLSEKGARKVVPLTVSGPFHSPMLKPAGDNLRKYLDDTEISELKVPYVANVNAEVITDTSMIRDLLQRQVSSPVKWEQSLRTLKEYGVDLIIEIGPGKTIAGFVKKTIPEIPVINVSSVEDIAKVKEALNG
jgi:[acyl-carrier-protein] S-malonyltransferase